MSAPELKNCPFCGGDASAEPHLQHKPGCYFDVLARFKTAPIGDLSMADEVLAAWNRRAQPAEKVQPVAWVLTRQLEQRETTCNARLWFSDPQNAAWTPIYTRPPEADADRLDAERYRWLRNPMSGSTRHDPKVYKDGPQEDVEWAYGEELDTIVDEAMARDFAQRAKWEKKAMSPTTTIAALAASKEKKE